MINTLVIIGNGFDLAHGIKSSYKDFRDWLRKSPYKDLEPLMDIFFSNNRDVWGDLETALGEYDEDSIIEYCKPDEDFDYDHPTQSVSKIEDGPDWIFRPVLDKFLDAFEDWVNSIEVHPAEPFLPLCKSHKYFSFNYTETLESEYNIPDSNILHIHGYRLAHNRYIIGHGNLRDTKEPYNDENEMPYIQDTQSKIISWMNGLKKDTNHYIQINKPFFSSLSNIDRIIVYGMSFSRIDWPYLEEIINNTGLNKQWTIHYHTLKDKANIDNFIHTYHLKNVTLLKVK